MSKPEIFVVGAARAGRPDRGDFTIAFGVDVERYSRYLLPSSPWGARMNDAQRLTLMTRSIEP